MSVSLSYSTAQPVSSTTRAAILSAAEQINAQRDWWCESIIFFDSLADGRLRGDTKLFLTGYGTAGGKYTEVDPEDDALMAWRDARFILERLAAWSKEYSVVWELASEGLPMGRIQRGVLPAEVLDTLDELLSAFGLLPGEPGIEQRAQQISVRHAARNA